MDQHSPSIADKRRSFRQLHESGCFVIPNPWDPGSARYLQSLGFKAVATTSSGFAWSQARPDNGVTVDQVIEHLRAMVAAVDIPVNADFEAGFAADAAGLHRAAHVVFNAGGAGLSIEDATGDAAQPLYALDVAIESLRAARRAIDATGASDDQTLLVGRPDLAETIKRLQAYAEAGADCLYAPGIRTKDEIRAVVEAVAPKPVNVLIGWPTELTVQDLAALGVRRISVGGALARSAWGGFMRAAKEIAEAGSFAGFGEAASGMELNGLFGRA
jgi:2-methylisocitrate lyase-like PEP mutase family enzyme